MGAFLSGMRPLCFGLPLIAWLQFRARDLRARRAGLCGSWLTRR